LRRFQPIIRGLGQWSIIERMVRSQRVKQLAAECGFDLAGVAAAEPTIEALFYPQWLAKGYAGEMGYLKGRRGEMRADPKTLLPTAKSLVCLGLVYNAAGPLTTVVDAARQGWVSRYAWGQDYHAVIRERLDALVGAMRREWGPLDAKVAVDTSPLLERAYAHHAGLGWIGKNTCLINQQLGSWVLLGEILSSLELEPDKASPFRCGTCTRCIEACPTDALVPTGMVEADGPAYALDSERCISYWTIELRGSIPAQGREAMGPHLFGCDICQDVCPWNRRAATTDDPVFQPANMLPALDDLATLTEEEFDRRFAGSPIERSRYRGFLRNVAVAMGNSGNRQFLPALRRMAGSPDAVISEHADWAIARLEVHLLEEDP
jgi:epoxyqueuosine reductase